MGDQDQGGEGGTAVPGGENIFSTRHKTSHCSRVLCVKIMNANDHVQ